MNCSAQIEGIKQPDQIVTHRTADTHQLEFHLSMFIFRILASGPKSKVEKQAKY